MTDSSSYHNRHNKQVCAVKPTVWCKPYSVKCQTVAYQGKSNSLILDIL